MPAVDPDPLDRPFHQGLVDEIRKVQEAEDYELTGDGRVTIKVKFFQELVTARATLWALQAAGVDNWEGHADALAEPLGDEWVKELA